jgi:DNA-binding Lrp family transcriptional regulator
MRTEGIFTDLRKSHMQIRRLSQTIAKYFKALQQKVTVEIQMPTAFVLINTEIGSEADVLKDLKKVEGVEEAHAVYGVYDIIARVKASTMDRLKEIVTWKVRRLDKVRSTLTMIVVEEPSTPK